MGECIDNADTLDIHPPWYMSEQEISARYVSVIFNLHSLPVEAAFVLDASAVRETSEVDFTKQFLEFREEFVEAGCIICYGREKQSSWRDMLLDLLALFKKPRQ